MTSTVLLIIFGIFVALTALFARFDGLAWLAPKRTARMSGSAQHFCDHHCKNADGSCPLVDVHLKREDCPLWRFVEADLSTMRKDPHLAWLKGVKS